MMEIGILIASGGVLVTLIIYLLKTKVGKPEADICRSSIKELMMAHKEVSDVNHAENRNDLRSIRKGVAKIVQRQYPDNKAGIKKRAAQRQAHLLWL